MIREILRRSASSNRHLVQICAACVLACVFLLGAMCHGPTDYFSVTSYAVDTHMSIKAGSEVHVISAGEVNFGGGILNQGPGAPNLNADGDNQPAPADYPYPGLNKNSLVCKVGTLAYQCGVDRKIYPTQDGALYLQPNDGYSEDNSGEWRVKVTVTLPPDKPGPGTEPCPGGGTPPECIPKPSTQPQTYGPIAVSNREVTTQVWIKAGSQVHVTSPNQDLIDFGGAVLGMGAPKLNADGDDEVTPGGYPAENLRKNSLICKVGNSWYQGGTDATFSPAEDGLLVLRPNDNELGDNSRGWHVTVTVTPPGA